MGGWDWQRLKKKTVLKMKLWVIAGMKAFKKSKPQKNTSYANNRRLRQYQLLWRTNHSFPWELQNGDDDDDDSNDDDDDSQIWWWWWWQQWRWWWLTNMMMMTTMTMMMTHKYDDDDNNDDDDDSQISSVSVNKETQLFLQTSARTHRHFKDVSQERISEHANSWHSHDLDSIWVENAN